MVLTKQQQQTQQQQQQQQQQEGAVPFAGQPLLRAVGVSPWTVCSELLCGAGAEAAAAAAADAAPGGTQGGAGAVGGVAGGGVLGRARQPAAVRSAAIRVASELLSLCQGGSGGVQGDADEGGSAVARGGPSEREWRRLVAAVLQAAGGAAHAEVHEARSCLREQLQQQGKEKDVLEEVQKEDLGVGEQQVFDAALAFTRRHCGSAGWQHGVRSVVRQLYDAAVSEEGAVEVYGSSACCRAAAGAAALQAALGPECPLGLLVAAHGGRSSMAAAAAGGEGASESTQGEVLALLRCAALCVSDGVRRWRGEGREGGSGFAPGDESGVAAVLLGGSCPADGPDAPIPIQAARRGPGGEQQQLGQSGGGGDGGEEAEEEEQDKGQERLGVAGARGLVADGRALCRGLGGSVAAADALGVLEVSAEGGLAVEDRRGSILPFVMCL